MSKADRCDECGDRLRVGDWPFCKGSGSHTPARRHDAAAFTPIEYYVGPNGDEYHPGRAGCRRTKAALERDGYQLRQITNMYQYNKWQQHQSTRINCEREQLAAKESAYWGEQRAESRKQLHHEMQHMTPFGRDLARIAIERNNAKERHRFRSSPAPQVEAMEYDNSNRYAWRDRDGRGR
jgi:hypothetical protein